MSGRFARAALLVLAALVASGALAPAAACATCFGAGDEAMTQGMNNAILTLLAIVGVVQGGFVALFWSVWRRGRRLRDRRAQFQIIDGGGH